MITQKQQQAAADELRKYLLPDCLKPEFNGMSSFELAGKVCMASEWAGREQEPKEADGDASEDERWKNNNPTELQDERSEKEQYRNAH